MVIEEVQAGRRTPGVGPLFGLTPLDGGKILYRDDGEVLGCVLRLEGDPSIYAHTLKRDALRRLGAHPTVPAASARSSARSAPRRASCGRSSG